MLLLFISGLDGGIAAGIGGTYSSRCHGTWLQDVLTVFLAEQGRSRMSAATGGAAAAAAADSVRIRQGNGVPQPFLMRLMNWRPRALPWRPFPI